MTDEAKCAVCGEPMPAGEEMFKFHGYSGPCPKSALPQPKLDTVVEYLYRQTDGSFWLDIRADGQPWAQIGPFDTEAERHAAKADMLNMMRSFGAKNLPNAMQ